MSRDHWGAILASTPLNATAGAVTSKGYQYVPQVPNTERQWEGPPPMVRHIADANHPDLTGKVVGRLTVIGKLAERPCKDTMWVCRCACGKYVGRRSKGLKAAAGPMACEECFHTRVLREVASGNGARQRAEAPEARKWTAAPPISPTVKETK